MKKLPYIDKITENIGTAINGKITQIEYHYNHDTGKLVKIKYKKVKVDRSE